MKADIIATCLSEKKGTSKTDVGKITLVENQGVEGDAHAGPGNRQVSLIGMETVDKMRDLGIDIGPGGFGENITTQGVILWELPVGTNLRIGDVEMVVTQIGKECHTACAIRKKVGDCPMPREGIFAAVVKGGEICVGQTIEID
jgi:MOSC domain-containing protein YiiM